MIWSWGGEYMLTIKEAADWMAKQLGREAFSQATIRSWIFLKRLPGHLVGGRTYVSVDDLQKFLPKTIENTQQLQPETRP
jgi:hypothetical protein